MNFRFSAWSVAFLILACCNTVAAQDSVPHFVEIFWHNSKVVALPDVTNVVVLDDSVCRAEISQGLLTFYGLARGETVAFAWVNGERVSLRISVVAKPLESSRPNLIARPGDSGGSGVFGSSVQTFLGANGTSSQLLVHRLEWRDHPDGRGLTVRAQAQDSTNPGAPMFNIDSASVIYDNARMKVSLMDFPLEVNGGLEGRLTPNSAQNVYAIRGASVSIRRGSTRVEGFGGATIPSYYRNLSGTRDVAGVNFSRRQNNSLFTYATTGFVSAPAAAGVSGRKNSLFQTAGFAYRPDARWGFEASGGGSTRGGLGQGAVSFTGSAFTAFVSGTHSSPNFPLNQLQLLFLGGSSAAGGASVRVSSKITGSAYFQHSATRSTDVLPLQGQSDYVSANLGLYLTSSQAVTLNYTNSRNRSRQGLFDANDTQRWDVALNSRLMKRVSNTIQFTLGRNEDPSQVHSQRDYTIRESVIVPIPSGSLTVGVQHARRDPSFIKRLSDRLSDLPADFQELFRLNPGAFVQPADLPLEVRSLLDELRSGDTEIHVSAQFHAGRRISISPNAGYSHDAASRSKTFGYSLTYQIAPSLQLTSSMSKAYGFDPQRHSIQSATVTTFGINKTFSGVSGFPFRLRHGTIRGRIFVDLDLNGKFNAGEPGLAGLHVELDDKGKTAVTDSEGKFEFSGLRPDTYRVHVALDQFTQGVRLTGAADVVAPLLEGGTAEANFGVVNFARVMGNVFNDYLMNGKKQPDASGLPHIRLLLTSKTGVRREFLSDGAGDYGVFDVSPGDYELTVDRATLPPNYMAGDEPISIHVEPVTTIVRDIPVRAVRSIAGQVLFKSAPVAGVQLHLGAVTATTGPDGSFVLRNLAAGDFTLAAVPRRPLPPGLNAPSGKITLTQGPMTLDNVTIVITNDDLLQYLIR